MGRATITGGGTDGRYSIQVDYGSAQRDALLAAYNQLVERYNTDIVLQQVEIDKITPVLQERVDRLTTVRNGVMPEGFPEFAEPPANLHPGAPIDKKTQDFLLQVLLQNTIEIRADIRKFTLNKERMEYERAAARAKIATLSTATAVVNKDAWCCTFTEDAPAGATVATVDINGESDLTLIAPGARTWAAADGVMTMPHVMSPEQSFFNTAILPGWQRHRPTFRWGTIAVLDKDANTATVNLAAATSSAQSLPINAVSVLSSIPVQYMTCNAQAFNVGDRVVVQYTETLPGQFDAKVIGFLDNPKPCQRYTADFRWDSTATTEPKYQQRFRGQDWAPITAPEPASAAFAWFGWSDGVATRARADGRAIANIDAHPRFLRIDEFQTMADVQLFTLRTTQIYAPQITGESLSVVNNGDGTETATVTATYTVTRFDSRWPAVPAGSASGTATRPISDASAPAAAGDRAYEAIIVAIETASPNQIDLTEQLPPGPAVTVRWQRTLRTSYRPDQILS